MTYLDESSREASILSEFVKETEEMCVIIEPAYSHLLNTPYLRQTIMERFVSDYAAVEDKIRSLWQQLLHVHGQSIVRPSDRPRVEPVLLKPRL